LGNAPGDRGIEHLRAKRLDPFGELPAAPRADGAHIDVDLAVLERGEDSIGSLGDCAERVIVGDHAEDDVGRGGHFAGRFAPLQSQLDQRLGLGLGAVGSVELVARVE
jgi:hypothetical protein